MAAAERATYELCDIFWYTRPKNCEKRQLALSYPSVRPSVWKNSASTGRIFTKFDICLFFDNLAREPKFDKYLTSITGTLL